MQQQFKLGKKLKQNPPNENWYLTNGAMEGAGGEFQSCPAEPITGIDPHS